MSHFSTSTTGAEEPPEEGLTLDEDLTLDLPAPRPVKIMPSGQGGSVDMPARPAPDQPSVQADENEDAETLDALDPGEETLAGLDMGTSTLIGCELQDGKYRVLSVRPAALRRAPLAGETPQTGMSYIALHTGLQKRLTLRCLPLDTAESEQQRDQIVAQFLREVRVLARLDHPSLPRVHDYFYEGTACYVVMDELAEYTLADVLAAAAQKGRVPALPPVAIARLGMELARALSYLHQQHPPLVLGGLRPEDIALPDDGPAQLVSLGALSLLTPVPSASLPGFPAGAALPLPDLPTLPGLPLDTAPAAGNGNISPRSPQPDDDLYSLGILLRELAGGAEVVARVMDRLHRPDEASRADGGVDAPPISLVLAAVIQVAAHDDPAQRFQNAAALENALERAWTVERRIVRRAEGADISEKLDEQTTSRDNGRFDLAVIPSDMEWPEAEDLSTRYLAALRKAGKEPPAIICWRCGARNKTSARLCRVCGVRQPLLPEGMPRPASPAPRRRSRPARGPRKRFSSALDEVAWAEWGEDEEDEYATRPRRSVQPTRHLETDETLLFALQRRYTTPAPRDTERRILWALVWVCFGMATLLSGITIFITYLALH